MATKRLKIVPKISHITQKVEMIFNNKKDIIKKQQKKNRKHQNLTPELRESY